MNTNAIKALIIIDEALVPALKELRGLEEAVVELADKVEKLKAARHNKLQALRGDIYEEDYPATYKYGDNIYMFTWADGGPQFALIKKTLEIS